MLVMSAQGTADLIMSAFRNDMGILCGPALNWGISIHSIITFSRLLSAQSRFIITGVLVSRQSPFRPKYPHGLLYKEAQSLDDLIFLDGVGNTCIIVIFKVTY